MEFETSRGFSGNAKNTSRLIFLFLIFDFCPLDPSKERIFYLKGHKHVNTFFEIS